MHNYKKKMKKFDQKATDKIEVVKRVSTEKKAVLGGTLNPFPSHTTLEVKYKHDRRSSRLFDLYVLSQAYFKYQLFYLCQSKLKDGTDYNMDENTSMLINTFFKRETAPADFMQTQDESSNEVIALYQDYQSFLDIGFLDKNVVDAFCKASEHNFGSTLKINSAAFANQILTLTQYNSEEITKNQIQERLVDYCIFSQKTKKLNTILLKKTIHSIEKLYTEILSKRALRQLNNL